MNWRHWCRLDWRLVYELETLMYELQVDLVFYNDKVMVVFGTVGQVFSIVIVDIEHVGGQLLDQYGVLLVVDQQVLVEEQVLVDQVVQLKIHGHELVLFTLFITFTESLNVFYK